MLSDKEKSILDKAEDAILRKFDTEMQSGIPMSDATFESLMDGIRTLDRICRMKYQQTSGGASQEPEKASGTDGMDRYRMQRTYITKLPAGGRIDIGIKADAMLAEGDSEKALSEIGIAARLFYMELAKAINKTL